MRQINSPGKGEAAKPQVDPSATEEQGLAVPALPWQHPTLCGGVFCDATLRSAILSLTLLAGSIAEVPT